MKRLTVAIFGMILIASQGAVFAISPNNIVISALQTESATSASEEYITIHNTGSIAVDVTSWRLQYFSATAANFTSPSRTITLASALAPNSDITVSSTGYTAQNSTIFFNATLSAAGGHVRLVSGTPANEIVHDTVGWGSALHPEQSSADVVARGTAYRRMLVDGQPVDTDNNHDDFSLSASAATPVAVLTPQTPTNPTTSTSSYEGLTITELLPDPTAPLTDASDEFIELYNDTSAAIDLSGLTLQTGNSNTYSYKLTGLIASHGYLVLYSSQTKLTLSNSGGRSQIIDATGNVIDETASYSAAPTGSSWQLYVEQWSWSNRPTPAAANPAPPAGTATTPKVKAASTTVLAAKAKIPTAAKTTKAAANKAANTSSNGQPVPALQPSAINKSILVGVGILALGYVLYEYRYDIAQKYRHFRGDRTARPKDSL